MPIVIPSVDVGESKEYIFTNRIPEISDKYASEYGSNDRTFRYIAKNVITVCTSDVDEVLALMSRQSELLICLSSTRKICVQGWGLSSPPNIATEATGWMR